MKYSNTKAITKRRSWTADDIKTVTKLWTTQTSKEIQETLNIKQPQLSYIVKEIRKAGYDLPRKRRTGVIQNLIREALNIKVKAR